MSHAHHNIKRDVLQFNDSKVINQCNNKQTDFATWLAVCPSYLCVYLCLTVQLKLVCPARSAVPQVILALPIAGLPSFVSSYGSQLAGKVRCILLAAPGVDSTRLSCQWHRWPALEHMRICCMQPRTNSLVAAFLFMPARQPHVYGVIICICF